MPMRPLSLASQDLQTDDLTVFGVSVPLMEKLVLKDFGEYVRLVSDAYEAAPTREPGALPHWQALKASTEKLFKRISSKVQVQFVDQNPYTSAEQMREEVQRTKVLKIWKGESDHSVFGQQVNLQFRAVHDWITHIVCGFTFGVKGEIQAYNRHAKLAPPEALPALFTEVVGQACVYVTTGHFPEQKIAVLRGFDYNRLGVVDGYDVQDKTLVKRPEVPQAKPVQQAPAAKPPVNPKQVQQDTAVV